MKPASQVQPKDPLLKEKEPWPEHEGLAIMEAGRVMPKIASDASGGDTTMKPQPIGLAMISTPTEK